MSPIDFSGGPAHATAVADRRVIKTVTLNSSRPGAIDKALDLACAIVPPMDSVARLVRASAEALCPAHDVSPLVTRYVSAVAAIPPDWHDAYPALAAKRVPLTDMEAFKAMSAMPGTNEHISGKLSGDDELRCLCSPDVPKPTRRLILDSRVSAGCIVRPAHRIDNIHPERWPNVRIGVEGQRLDPVLGTIWRISETLPAGDREPHTSDLRAVLDTLVGRKRWDTRMGWHSGRIDWPSSLHHGDVAHRVLDLLRREELAQIFRSQLGIGTDKAIAGIGVANP